MVVWMSIGVYRATNLNKGTHSWASGSSWAWSSFVTIFTLLEEKI